MRMHISPPRQVADAFMFLIPCSPSARRSLQLYKRNRFHRREVRTCPELASASIKLASHELEAVQLDFGWIVGRRSGLHFGASAASEFQLSEDDGASTYQFRIHFELSSGIVLITDMSSCGTFIESFSLHRPLQKMTWPLLHSTHIAFGGDRYRFRAVIVDQRKHPMEFRRAFFNYARSIAQPQPWTYWGPGAGVCEATLLAGRFVRLHKIGEGAFGRLHVGLDARDGSLVAIKEFHKAGRGSEMPLSSEGDVQHALAEVALTQRLQNTYIIRTLSTGKDYTTEITTAPFLVMEYLPGGCLHRHMTRCSAALDLRQVHEVLKSTLTAMEYLHSLCVIHHDIKPQNILIRQNPFTTVLCDFGLAQVATFVVGSYPGTHGYMAPEIRQASGHDARVDVWSLGIVICQACGVLPLDGASSDVEATEAVRQIPCPLLADLLSRMLHTDGRFRYTASQCLQHGFLRQRDPGVWPIGYRGAAWLQLTKRVASSQNEFLAAKRQCPLPTPNASECNAGKWPCQPPTPNGSERVAAKRSCQLPTPNASDKDGIPGKGAGGTQPRASACRAM